MRGIIFGVLAALATPGLAQEAPDTSRDTVTVGIGPIYTPRFEGARDYQLAAGAALRGKIGGISFTTPGPALFVDLIASPPGPGTKLVLGPIVHATLNRSSLKRVRDPQIVALGKVPVAVEAGGHIGIARTGVITSAYDSLTFDLAVSHDVTGIHDSLIVTPSINYGTPLSRRAFVGVSVSATHVGGGYARRYFGVNAAQATASGLAAYTPRDGFKDVTFGTIGNLALTGDLLHGLSLFATGSYSRLLASIGRSPVVRDRDQWFGGAGLAYTF